MTILYVDDDDEDRKVFSEAVATVCKMTRCLTAQNANSALKILKYTIPDLILLDVNMPGMTGKDLLKIIRSDRAMQPVPVIMYSTTIGPEDDRMYKTLGANHCLIKPTTFEDLRKAIAELLNKKFGNAVL